jgi:Ion channel
LSVPRTGEDRFGLVLVSIVLAILALAAAGNSRWGRLLSVALLGATLLFILRTTEAGSRFRVIAAIVVLAAVIAAAVSALLGDPASAEWAVPTVGAFLAVGAPVAIARRLVHQDAVTFQTVLGALCLYLLAGMFFAFLYGTVAALTDGPFFSGSVRGSSLDVVYFSFVTLATVGYGDVTAATDLGRMLAITEALIGQLYLVTVVAVLVSNLGARKRDRNTERGD